MAVRQDEWVAREGIRDLVARYNALGDAGKTAEVADLFAPDGSLEMGRRETAKVAKGRQQIRELLDSVKSEWAQQAETADARRYVRHFVSTHVIDMLDADRARGSSYVLVLRFGGLASWGRYLDEYARLDDRWVFTVRRAIRDGQAADG